MTDENMSSTTEPTALIHFRNIDIWQEANLIINQASFIVRPNELVYLLGRTGSGKSSLLKVIYADLSAKGDLAMAAGFDLMHLRKKDIPALRRKLGMVFQDFQLLTDRNVFENLRFVLRATGWEKEDEIKNRIAEVLDMMNLNGKDTKMPHQLSGGEQQKVCIARAILNNPEIILADEPTGNLDPESSEEVMRSLMMLKDKGKTIIMATHDMIMVERFPSRILECKDGKLL